jgi:hypothetical protein
MGDRELDKMVPFLKSLVQRRVPDVRSELRMFRMYGHGNMPARASYSP